MFVFDVTFAWTSSQKWRQAKLTPFNHIRPESDFPGTPVPNFFRPSAIFLF